MARAAVKADDEDVVGLGSPLLIKLSKIERYEQQPRRYFDQAGLEELADSIHEHGQKQPVKVCKHSTKPGVFVLIGGERRWRAFHIIHERTGREPTVKAFIDAVKSEREHFREALLDNLQREDLVPVDEAASYKRLYDDETDRKASHSARVATIAQLVKKSNSHVDNYLRIDSLPYPVKKLLGFERPLSERLTITAAIDIAKSTANPQLQLAIAKEAIERNLGIDETRMLISVKTGKSGYGAGGVLRRPSDQYRSHRAFLNSTLSKLRRIQETTDLEALYASREDEDDDRKADAETIDLIIKGLTQMSKETKESDV